MQQTIANLQVIGDEADREQLLCLTPGIGSKCTVHFLFVDHALEQISHFDRPSNA